MRLVLGLLALVFASGCLPAAVLAPPGKPRQCEMPVMIGVSENIPEHLRAMVWPAFELWNKKFGKDLFVYGDIVPAELSGASGGGFVIVRMAEKDDPQAYAVTFTRKLFNGCMAATYVELMPSMLKITDDWIETVIRHEAGHVLGLPHNPHLGDLMYFQVDPSVPNPLEPSEEDLTALHQRY